MMTGKLPSQFGKRERLETFSKYFLPGEERERDGYVDLAGGHY